MPTLGTGNGKDSGIRKFFWVASKGCPKVGGGLVLNRTVPHFFATALFAFVHASTRVLCLNEVWDSLCQSRGSNPGGCYRVPRTCRPPAPSFLPKMSVFLNFEVKPWRPLRPFQGQEPSLTEPPQWCKPVQHVKLVDFGLSNHIPALWITSAWKKTCYVWVCISCFSRCSDQGSIPI